MKIVFIGDIVGRLGRRGVIAALPEIKKQYRPDLIIANAENASHGDGVSRSSFAELREAGVDFFTLGDHSFRRQETIELLKEQPGLIIRPANYPPGAPGRGSAVLEVGSQRVLVINMLGRVFMKSQFDCPFRGIDALLESAKKEKYSAIIVDFHAEATSEKVAFGLYVDGRVTAVLGTHTHIPTADLKILPQGTAYVSDVGMAGGELSVIGGQADPIIKQFLDQVPRSFDPLETGPYTIGAVLLETDPKTRLAKQLTRIDKRGEA